jgi:hypothetical protein
MLVGTEYGKLVVQSEVVYNIAFKNGECKSHYHRSFQVD